MHLCCSCSRWINIRHLTASRGIAIHLGPLPQLNTTCKEDASSLSAEGHPLLQDQHAACYTDVLRYKHIFGWGCTCLRLASASIASIAHLQSARLSKGVDAARALAHAELDGAGTNCCTWCARMQGPGMMPTAAYTRRRIRRASWASISARTSCRSQVHTLAGMLLACWAFWHAQQRLCAPCDMQVTWHPLQTDRQAGRTSCIYEAAIHWGALCRANPQGQHHQARPQSVALE